MVISINSDEQSERVQPEAPASQGQLEDLGEVDVGGVDVSGEAPVTEVAPAPEEGQPVEAVPSVQAETTVTETATLDAPPMPTQDASATASQLEELQKMRHATAQKDWEQRTLRQAQALERQAQERGSDPQSARQTARQYVAHQKELRDQESTAFNVINFVEGQKNAAMHFAQKYKLVDKSVVEDLAALARFKTPQEMEHEAKRMSQLRAQAQEIARLKQGRVPPQTFDNSQGATEASTNDQRLLDSYNAGDRSDAAVRAARKMAFGA